MARTLKDICFIRSGDKGNTCTAGLLAKAPEYYPLLLKSVTPDKIRKLYGEWINGAINCYPMDNIHALVVVMEGGLGGGATQTLRLDQTGKSMGHAILRLPIVD